jgi:single-strand DNA-binding protein
MNAPLITLQGNLGTEVTLRDAAGAPVAEFRLGVTPSRYDRRTGAWVDSEPQWYRVTVWRTLALHCAQSLQRGDPVVVTGRLTQDHYTTRDGQPATSWEVTATGVGHDLLRGTSVFTRLRGGAEPGEPQDAGAAGEAQDVGVAGAVGTEVSEPAAA